jgi:hypothetical protein
MQIGGHDVIVEGQAAPEAPDFVRQRLCAVWPEGIVHDAEIAPKLSNIFWLTHPGGLWRIPVELLCYKRLVDLGNDYPYLNMLHLIFEPRMITLVAGDDTLGLANEIAAALRENGFVR